MKYLILTNLRILSIFLLSSCASVRMKPGNAEKKRVSIESLASHFPISLEALLRRDLTLNDMLLVSSLYDIRSGMISSDLRVSLPGPTIVPDLDTLSYILDRENFSIFRCDLEKYSQNKMMLVLNEGDSIHILVFDSRGTFVDFVPHFTDPDVFLKPRRMQLVPRQ
jgi:hypothetical protein